FVNEKNILYLSASGFLSKNSYDGFLSFKNVDENDVFLGNRSIRNMNIDNLTSGYTINSGWQKNFKNEGHILDVNFNISDNYDNNTDRYAHDFFNNSDVITNSNYQTVENLRHYGIIQAKIDYEIPLDSGITIQAGFHFI